MGLSGDRHGDARKRRENRGRWKINSHRPPMALPPEPGGDHRMAKNKGFARFRNPRSEIAGLFDDPLSRLMAVDV
jgi:hypothetical protein